MVSFEIFVKSMPPSLLEVRVIPSFCFAFKIPDDVTATTKYLCMHVKLKGFLEPALRSLPRTFSTVFVSELKAPS